MHSRRPTHDGSACSGGPPSPADAPGGSRCASSSGSSASLRDPSAAHRSVRDLEPKELLSVSTDPQILQQGLEIGLRHRLEERRPAAVEPDFELLAEIE